MKLEHIMALKTPVQSDQAPVGLHFVTMIIASANCSSITYRGNVQLLFPFLLRAHPCGESMKQAREASKPVKICLWNGMEHSYTCQASPWVFRYLPYLDMLRGKLGCAQCFLSFIWQNFPGLTQDKGTLIICCSTRCYPIACSDVI